ncbi:MAG: DivIVA domain-containing protein [Candidatus Latescibacterota bacterium]|nr:MAG: DivIVA domain-containing protein [Candidatus Latescibacterota bacterium]
MKISPLDIRKQTFRKSLRGVDEQEVASFLEMVADQVEELAQENRTLRERMGTSEIQLENYRRIEEALRNALVTAEKVARDTKKNADQEVEIRLKDADLRAQKAIQTARGILESMRGDLVDITKQRRDFLARFRMLVETQVKMLDLKRVEYEGEEDVRRLEEIQRALFEDFRTERTTAIPSAPSEATSGGEPAERELEPEPNEPGGSRPSGAF